MKKSFIDLGQKIDLLDFFNIDDGEINFYYGRIGEGKTYGGTADAYEDLLRGQIVYTNWPLNFNGVDQRKEILFLIGGLIFPWRNTYFKFPKENWHLLPVDGNFHENFSKITSAKVYLDEGHVVFDSYEMAKLSMDKRISVLHTRHFDRSINIISQRPTAVHVTMRANVNRFYKFDKLLHLGNLILFRRREYQDMTQETVDETESVSTKLYFAKQFIFNLYNSKYLRGDLKESQTVNYEAYKLTYIEKIASLLRVLFGVYRKKNAQE